MYLNKCFKNLWFNHVQERVILLIILDILADTHGFEKNFAHQLTVGMPDGDRNNFGVSFAFEDTKLLKQNLLYFIGLRTYFNSSIFKNIAMSAPKSSPHGFFSYLA